MESELKIKKVTVRNRKWGRKIKDNEIKEWVSNHNEKSEEIGKAENWEEKKRCDTRVGGRN